MFEKDGQKNESSEIQLAFRWLAYELVLLDRCVPFVFGFPAVAVLPLWTVDRRHKQNMSA